MRLSICSLDVCASVVLYFFASRRRHTRGALGTGVQTCALPICAQHPLLTLVAPDQTNSDIVKSLVASRKASPHGILPVWQFHGRETWTMIGYHAVPEIGRAPCRARVCQSV